MKSLVETLNEAAGGLTWTLCDNAGARQIGSFKAPDKPWVCLDMSYPSDPVMIFADKSDIEALRDDFDDDVEDILKLKLGESCSPDGNHYWMRIKK